MGYIGMCGAKGYGFFSAVLVRNRVSILTILVRNRVWFVHSSLELAIFLDETTSLSGMYSAFMRAHFSFATCLIAWNFKRKLFYNFESYT